MRKRWGLILLAWLLVSGLACAERKPPVIVGQEERARVEIRVAGDFVIHDSLISSAKQEAQKTGADCEYDFSLMLAPVKDILSGADLTVVNVDGVFYGNEKKAYSGYPAFNTPSELIDALKDAGVDVLTMANNHALDFWYDGLKASIDRVEAAGLMHLGAARTQEEHDAPCVVSLKGIHFGFLNYTTSLNLMDRQKGLDPDALVFGVNFTKYADYTGDVQRLRDAGAEIIVCFMHWGTEYRMTTPSSTQQDIARKLMKAGVDVIVGGHPHVVEQADWISGVNQFGEEQKTLCVYSLGNFLSGQRTSGRDGGIVFRFVVEKDAEGGVNVTDASYISTWVWKKASTYRILPLSDTRPEGLSNGEWNSMRACIRLQEKAMENGSLKLRAAAE